MKNRPRSPAVALLLFTFAGPSATAPDVSFALDPSHRAPLPECVRVLRIAPSEPAIWFLGVDRSSDPVRPAAFAWSSAGMARVALPALDDGADPAQFAIAADRNGDALLLAGGKVWASRGGSFRPVDLGSRLVVRLAGREGFWLLTDQNEILYLAGAQAAAERAATLDRPVTAWSVGAAGELWYAIDGGDIWSVHPHAVPHALKVETGADVTAILADDTEQVWIGLADGRIARHVAGATDWFDASLAPAAGLVQDAYGNLLLAHSQTPGETTWLTMQPRNLRSNLGAEFRRLVLNGAVGAVHDLAQDHLGGTWVAGDNGAFRLQGIAEFNWPRRDANANTAASLMKAAAMARATASAPVNQSQSLTGFNAMPGARVTYLNSSRGLPSDSTSCAVSDGSNMWFGTGFQNLDPDGLAAPGAGVIKWDHRQFTHITAGLPHQTVQACAFDPASGALWFGTPNGVARLLNGGSTNFLPGTAVLDIAVRGGDVWVGTLAGGVVRLSAASGAQTGQFSAGNNRVTSLVFDKGGTLWAGTGAGLHRFTGSAFVADSTGSIPPGDYVMDLEVDASNNLWIALWNKSVFRRTPAGAVSQHLIGPEFSGIRRVYAVRKDNFGHLWFVHGNLGGFSPNTAFTFLPADQMNAGQPAFQSYSTANGLPSNTVNFLAPEADGMWLTTTGGVWRIGGPFTKTGFPAPLSSFPVWTSPLLVDLDHDRDLEIVAGDDSGKITAFRPDGTTLWTYDTRNALPVPPGASRGPIAINSSPAAGDVDGDGEIEIVVGLGGPQEIRSYGGVLILSRTGQFKRLLNTFDITGHQDAQTSDGFPEHVFATSTLANLDADPELEITFGGFDNFLYAINGDGTVIYQRDDDGDGRYDEDYLGDTTPNTPFVSSDDAPGIKGIDDDGDGQVDEGPFASDDDEDGLVDEDYWEWPQNARDSVWASSVVADLDADGQKEIVFGHDYSGGTNQEFARGGVIRVFTPTGQPKRGFPRGNLEQVVWSSPIAVDLDNDGKYEIMHGTGIEMGTVGTTPAELLIGRLVYAWRSNGQPFRSCVGNTQPGCFATTEGRSFASFAVGDLDNDGFPELVIATTPLRSGSGATVGSSGTIVPENQAVGQQLYVFKADGSLFPGFPVRPNPANASAPLFGSPILADIDNDGFLDIILSVRFGLMVFNRFGGVVPGMGLWENLQQDNLGTEMNGTPAVADIDLDGLLELVWLAPSAGGGAVNVVRLGLANTNYYRSWPQWRRTINRNAVFGPLISLAQAWESAGTLVLRAQAMGGRSALASVTVNLTALGGPAAQAMLDQPNSFYETQLNVAQSPAGRYHLPVTVTDVAGRSDTQTIVFIKRGGTRQLAVSLPTLAFGTLRQGETGIAQLGLVNTGTEAVTITSITTNNSEFFLANPTGFPQVVQPGQALNASVRFRPGAAAGARNATLSIQSNDAVAATRTVNLTGSTAAGAGGCNVTLTKLTNTPTVTGAVPFQGEKGTIRVATSPAGCTWTASSDSSWLQIFPGSGTGDLLYYTVFPNLSLRPRSGRVWVNGSVLTINQGQAGPNENERFIAALYFGALGRYPSDSEIQFHLGHMTDRTTEAAEFFTSDEFKQMGRFIAGLYRGLLRRLPEYGGWAFQLNAFTSSPAGAHQTLTRNFLQSPEFLLANPSLTDEQFIQFLYTSILNRPATQPDLQFQLSNLKPGIEGRAEMALAFLLVPEYDLRTGPDLIAALLYFAFLQRDPTPEEFNALRARIPQGVTREQLTPIIREFIESSEYRAILI